MSKTPISTPAEAAALAQTGWLVFFLRLTLLDVIKLTVRTRGGFWRKLWALLSNMGGWFSNLVIAILQMLTFAGDWRSGMWQLIHVGVVIEKHGEKFLLEATYPRVRLIPLEKRLEAYPVAHLVPPRLPHNGLVDEDEWQNWIQFVDDMPYNKFGLLGVLLNIGGGGSPGTRFCSQLAAEAYQILDWLPKRGVVLAVSRGAEPRATDIPAGWYEPSGLAMSRAALNWRGELYVNTR